MQLQLSLTVADRLHETLLVRGEPIDAFEAVCLLTASSKCPRALCNVILDTIVSQDGRFCWGETRAGAAKSGMETPTSAPHRPHLSLRRWDSHDPDLVDVPFVALDLETTGARVGTCKITEIGAVRIEGFREVGRFGTLVNPMRPIPRMITEITGITQEMVADAPRIDEVIPELMSLLEGAVVVAHNATFDVGFLNYELRRLKGRELGDGAIDTLPLARALAPGLPNYRLRTVAEALGSPVAACHRALADAEAAGHVFVALMERLRGQGVRRLSEARSYMVPSSRPAIEKLQLTRGIPCVPGTYRFLDGEERVVFIGHADRLKERVRTHFVGQAASLRKLRQAVRMVERIEWEETYTTLEALVREQELILEHRPPCNQHGGWPESYVYLKVRDTGQGLCLYTSNRTPRNLTVPGAGRKKGRFPIVIGPFRGRSRLAAALDLLQRCYPIRRCPRQVTARPCPRGEAGDCLRPCLGDPATRKEHDALVRDLVAWLTGAVDESRHDPESRTKDLLRELTQQRRYEEAQLVGKARDDLLSIQRSYAALAEACSLRFAILSPLRSNGSETSLRLNIVWDGRMRGPVSLRPDDLRRGVETALAGCTLPPGRNAGGRTTRHVAVRQDEVDLLLAIRRWLKETEKPGAVLITTTGFTRAHLDTWKNQLLAEADRMLGEATRQSVEE